MTRSRNRPAALLAPLILAGVSIAPPATAQFAGQTPGGYLGAAFIQLPGVPGNWKGEDHRGWIMIDGHYWQAGHNPPPLYVTPQVRPAQAGAAAAGGAQQAAAAGAANPGGVAAAGAAAAGAGARRRGGPRATADIPQAPRSGEGSVIWSIDKGNASLAALMTVCRSGTTIPELGFSVSGDRSRTWSNIGPRPAGFPAYFDYTLKDVRLSCPVVEGAAEQAIIVRFNNIVWTNWTDPASTKPVQLVPASLPAIPKQTGMTKAWVFTWFGAANDTADDQCPKVNAKPTQEAYYALMTPEEAAHARSLFGEAGPDYQSGEFGRRGPQRIDATALPGVVPDPGSFEPASNIGRGIDLDGGRGPKHREYVSADGTQTGIDNSLYTVEGCINGKQGHRGLAYQFFNSQMRDGSYSILLKVDGIDDERNDKDVWVTLQLSNDPMTKSAAGDQILPDYSFRPSTNPEFAYYARRMRGRIVDGILTTDPVDRLDLNLGVYSNPGELKMYSARLRIALQPDGTIKGVLGGYLDWRGIVNMQRTSLGESYMGYQAPGVYYAMKRNADGLKNPLTGQYDGISTAYDIEGVPAIVVEPTSQASAGEVTTGAGR